jgi:hypothetical protein
VQDAVEEAFAEARMGIPDALHFDEVDAGAEDHAGRGESNEQSASLNASLVRGVPPSFLAADLLNLRFMFLAFQIVGCREDEISSLSTTVCVRTARPCHENQANHEGIPNQRVGSKEPGTE